MLFHFLFSDEDECSDPSKCLHGVCQNFRGGYQCLCDPGFVVTENMKDCVGQYHGTFVCLFVFFLSRDEVLLFETLDVSLQ